MRQPATQVVRMALLLLALFTASAMTATTSSADRPNATLDNAHMLRHDALSVTSRRVMRMAVHAPGQYAAEVMSVFQMRIDRFLPPPLGVLRLDGETLRPYLLGGRTALRLPTGRTVGENLPGGAQAFALHIGGGAELRLRDGLFLTVDVGEVLHSGALSDLSYETYKLGLLLDF